MPSVINTNVASLTAQRNLGGSQSALQTAMERLSSGLRINSAKDDAAGLAISQRMDAQVRGMNVAVRNANDAISEAQTADGALGNVSNMLQRMRELAVQASNATNGTSDLASLDSEYQQLATEIGRELTTTKFNGTQVLATTAAQTYQVGANSGDTISITPTDLSTNGSITSATGASLTGTGAAAAISAVDAALDQVNTTRASWGAAQSKFEAVVSGLQIGSENTAAAKSRITDADYAQETANMTRANILQQAGTAMLAQANQSPNLVLQLLK